MPHFSFVSHVSRSLTLILLFATLSPPALAQQAADSKRQASFLSERVPFLSAYMAEKYVPEYLQQSNTCLKRQTPSSANLGWRERTESCLAEAAQTIANQARQDHPELYNIHRMGRLFSQGRLSALQLPDSTKPTLAILGDSLASGSNADLRLTPEVWNLVGQGAFDFLAFHVSSSQRTLPPPHAKGGDYQPLTRILSGDKLRDRAHTWVDCEECSFAYWVGRHSGLPSQNIFMAAEMKSRIENLGTQIDRAALPLGHLPEMMILSFNGNDLCNLKNFKETYASKKESYRKMVLTQLERLTHHPRAADGTHVMVAGPANIAALIDSPSVLERKVPYHNGWPWSSTREITCRDFRTESVAFVDRLNKMCSWVLRTHPDDKAKISHIRDLHRAIVDAQAEAVAQANALWPQAKFQLKFYFNRALTEMDVTGGDVAHDCFHPSPEGHFKMAKAIMSGALETFEPEAKIESEEPIQPTAPALIKLPKRLPPFVKLTPPATTKQTPWAKNYTPMPREISLIPEKPKMIDGLLPGMLDPNAKPQNHQQRSAIWKPFLKRFNECAPGCRPAAGYQVHGARMCHAVARAIDLFGIECDDGKTYKAIKSGRDTGRFAEVLNCMFGPSNGRGFRIKNGLALLWHNGRDITKGHHDHAHISIGCHRNMF